VVHELRRRVGTALLLLGLLAGATSCFQASVGLEVADDGSGQLVVDLVPSPALLATVGGDLPAFAEQLRTAASAQTSGAVVRTEDTPQGEALHLELPFTDVKALTVDAGSANGGVTGLLLGGVVQQLEITRTDDVWSMVAVLDPRATKGGLLGVPPAAGSGLDQPPEVTFSVTLPGRVDSTNAPTSSGGTATWTVDTTATSPQTLRMVNSPLPVLPWVLAVLGGVLLLVVLAALVRRWRTRRVQAELQTQVQAVAAATVAASAATAPWGAGAAPGPAPTAPPEQSSPVPPAPEPPDPPVPAGPAPGWYPDPAGSAQLRWWDGDGWTEHLHDQPD
jgi:hypothetical protein